ncbi:MAG: MarR family transcriptional regulator [Actinomycetota bacterium]
MSGTASVQHRVDLTDAADRDRAWRIGKAWVELRRGASALALREYIFGDHPLEQGQMDALDLLVRRERQMRELAGRLRIDASCATRTVDRLVTAGLAERAPSPEDGRVVVVKVTGAGRAQHAAAAGRRSRAMARILAEFDEHDRDQLADLLDRFVASVDRVVDELD